MGRCVARAIALALVLCAVGLAAGVGESKALESKVPESKAAELDSRAGAESRGVLDSRALESASIDSTSLDSSGAGARLPESTPATLPTPESTSQKRKLYARSNSLRLLMAGDALLHTPVFKDAQKVIELDSLAESSSNPTAPESSRAESSGASKPRASQDSSSPNPTTPKSPARKTTTTYDFAPMFVPIAPIIARYDLAFYNQETILGGTQLGLSSYPSFNSPQEFGDTMLSLGFNLISLANNHTLDKGERGVRAMLSYWHGKEAESIARGAPIAIAGSYESQIDRNKPRIYEKNGITYALLAYTYGTNGIPIPAGKGYLVNVYTRDMLARDIAALREKVDLLLVSMHWGIEYSFTPSKQQRELARFLASLGVDIVIGNHPHVIQPIEWIDHTLVIYSHGNLISAQKGLEKRIGMLSSARITLLDEKQRAALARDIAAKELSKNAESKSLESSKSAESSKVDSSVSAAPRKPFVPKVRIDDVRAELIYTHYDSSMRNFAIYPLKKSGKLLPNAKQIYKDYAKKLKP